MSAGRHLCGDFGEVQVHRLSVAVGQDESCALALFRANRAENIGRGGTPIGGRGRPRPSFCPASGDLVLLADVRLIRKPDFYLLRCNVLSLK